MINRKLVLKVKSKNVENSYEVEFPNVGKFIDVENRKAQLSNDRYLSLLKIGTFASMKALDLIDMVSWFEILVPKLKDDLKVDNMLELGVLDAKELLKAYNEQFLPWIKEWMEVADIIVKEKNEDEIKENEEK